MAKVIILAAGEGSRLAPLTKKNPKCLVSFLGKTLLEYQLNVFEKFKPRSPVPPKIITTLFFIEKISL